MTALPGDYYHFDAVHHRLSGERTGRSFRLGDTTEVVVARVDLDERKIDFELAGNVLSAPIGRKKRNGDKSANAGKAPKGRKGASVPEVDLEPALASPDAAVVPRRKAGKVQALPPVAPELLAQAAEMLGNTDVRKSREVKQALLAEARVGGGKDKGGKKGKVVPAGKSAKGKAKGGKPAAAAKPGKPTKHRKGLPSRRPTTLRPPPGRANVRPSHESVGKGLRRACRGSVVASSPEAGQAVVAGRGAA